MAKDHTALVNRLKTAWARQSANSAISSGLSKLEIWITRTIDRAASLLTSVRRGTRLQGSSMPRTSRSSRRTKTLEETDVTAKCLKAKDSKIQHLHEENYALHASFRGHRAANIVAMIITEMYCILCILAVTLTLCSICNYKC